MKFTKGTAIYTGGGFYTIIGETDNGLYFAGYTDFCVLLKIDPRTQDEDGLIIDYNEKIEPYVVETDHSVLWAALEDFCMRLDNEEPDITDGYDHLSNYCPGEVCRYIDFSENIVDGIVKEKEENIILIEYMENRIMKYLEVRAKDIIEAIDNFKCCAKAKIEHGDITYISACIKE